MAVVEYFVEDTFAGVAGTQLSGHVPTTRALNAYWEPSFPVDAVLTGSNSVVNSHTLNFYALNLPDFAGGSGGHSDILQINFEVIVDISGATPFGGTYGGLNIYVTNEARPLGVSIILESGIVKAVCSLGNGSIEVVPLATKSTYKCKVQMAGTSFFCLVDDTIVSTSGGAAVAYVSGGFNTIGNLNASSVGVQFSAMKFEMLYDEPAPPTPSEFWTALRGAHESDFEPGGGGDGGDGDPPTGAGGLDQASAETVALDTEIAVGTGANERWFKFDADVTGSYTVTTRPSPNPSEIDTYLAVYNAAGNLLGANDDIDLDGDDYRSEVVVALTAGNTYYAAICWYPGDSGDGFSFDSSVPIHSGVIFSVVSP